MKMHILEGRNSEWKLTSCGLKIGTSEPTIGRALVMANQRTDEVTCERCRLRYRHYCDRGGQPVASETSEPRK